MTRSDKDQNASARGGLSVNGNAAGEFADRQSADGAATPLREVARRHVLQNHVLNEPFLEQENKTAELGAHSATARGGDRAEETAATDFDTNTGQDQGQDQGQGQGQRSSGQSASSNSQDHSDAATRARRQGSARPRPVSAERTGGRPSAKETDHRGDHHVRRPDLYAALDLGTNNCRLLVARPSRRGFTVVDAFSRIIRLGEGVSTTGHLSQAAMSRTIEALKVCAFKMKRKGVVRSRLIATEACRVASNGAEFLERVRNEVGIDLEMLSRENEAKLAVSGCASLIDAQSDLALVFDIGGGSSELIWLDLTKRRQIWRRSLAERLEAQNCISAWTSLPVGVVTLAEQFGSEFVDEAIFERMVAYVMDLLRPFEDKHNLRTQVANCRAHLLGTSGTVTTIAGIHLGLPRYDRRRVDGCWLETADVKDVTAMLVASDYAQRVAQPCIGRDRADLVLAGCAILEALLRMWPCERLRVADRGLREGMLAHMMAADGVYRYGRRPRGVGRA